MTRISDDMVQLTEALFRKQLSGMADLAAEEAALRNKLRELETLQRMQDVPEDALLDARRAGQDVLWRGWLDEGRAGLNRRLALVLARKSKLLRQLARAHGRNLAAREIRATAETARRRDSERRQQRSLDQLAVGKSAGKGANARND